MGEVPAHSSPGSLLAILSLLSLANPLVFLHLCVFNTHNVYLKEVIFPISLNFMYLHEFLVEYEILGEIDGAKP